MKHNVLDELVNSGTIKSYEFHEEDDETELFDVIIITFNDGKKISLESYSIMDEDTSGISIGLEE